MKEILAILVLLAFLLFLVLGVVLHLRKKGWKWICFILSALFLVWAFFIIAFDQFDLVNKGKEFSSPPIIEKTVKPSDNGGNQAKLEAPEKETPSSDDLSRGSANPQPQIDPEKAVPVEPVKIVVPGDGIFDYKVVKGDTLWSIAMRAGISIEKIKQWNGLTSDVISVDQIIKLYGKNVEPPLPKNPPPTQENPPTYAPSTLITHGSLQQKQIALTFDAGSDAVGIGILDALKKYEVKATFFLTGKWVEAFPDFARRIAAEGHEIGNHTYSHPDATKVTNDAFVQDIVKAEQVIKKITGKMPRPYFRFPFGAYNSNVLKAVGEAGYPMSIQWSLDTIDWKQPNTEVIVSRIEQGASNGDIILMHIGGKNTPEAVDKVIPELKAMGYQLVTISELLKE